jgi:nicotinamidase-related amidase
VEELNMTTDVESTLRRSPELMSRHDTALLVVDVQEKLMDRMKVRDLIVWNIRRLIETAGILGMPVAATEQYPKGLGETVAELAPILPPRPEKLTFSCCGISTLLEQLNTAERHKVLVVGIETHVCIQQTVFDLMSEGLHVYIPADAVASQRKFDWKFALRRMDSVGASITSTEAAMFELCETAEAKEFKEISKLAKEQPPGS